MKTLISPISCRATVTTLLLLLTLLCFHSQRASAENALVTVAVETNGLGELSPDFLGLSYESSMLLPQNGHYYFNTNDQALVNMFKTLGIKSLRVGANAVDDPRVPIPQEQDIDHLFNFARAAGVKVIYSFRLKNGVPADSARLARYIAKHDADALDCYAIGNEPNFYLHPFEKFFAAWKPHYDAILKAVPKAMFDGPSANGGYALDLAKAIQSDGHLKMASDHYYFLGSGRAGEKDPAATRARFLSDHLHASYHKDYARVGAVLAAKGVPYRIDEMNSCYDGGAKNSSDTYASTLWALDCTHWWAAHDILGVNYHTGESVGRDGKFGHPNYAAFLHRANWKGFHACPQAYALLAFTEGAHGEPLKVNLQKNTKFNFDAYAYRDHDGSIYLTLINKSYGDHAKPASVSLQLPQGVTSASWRRLNLLQKHSNIAAKNGVSLGGAGINAQGNWSGKWETCQRGQSEHLTIQVSPASSAILHFASTN